MSNLQVDLDRLARDFRAQLDSATAHIIAASVPGVELNHANGITLAGNVRAIAQFIMDCLPDGDVHNRERYRAFRDEAEKQVNQFWRTFNLFVIVRSNGQQVAVTPKPDATNGNGHMQPKSNIVFRHPRLSDAKVKMVRDLLKMCGETATMKEIHDIADQVGTSKSTVQRIYYGTYRPKGY